MRRELEAIIHPHVLEEMLGFFRKAEQEGAGLAAAEVPLWFECGWEKPRRALVAAVACPDEERRARLSRERGWSQEKTAAIESWQWSARDKENAADIILHNAGSLEDLERNAACLLRELEKRRAAAREDLSARLRALWGAS
jgi:23S rRNA pseudouridine1911/1915/1917 synthase